ncbi:hypothetical protein SLA2020_525650 [Shorea laevis]
MRIDGHLPDNCVLGFLVSSFSQAGKFDIAGKVLSEVQSEGLGVSSFVLNNMLNMMVKQNLVEEAVSLYKEHLRSNSCVDTWTFNILIRSLCRVGKVDQAVEIFSDMGNFGYFPDIVTYNTIIN